MRTLARTAAPPACALALVAGLSAAPAGGHARAFAPALAPAGAASKSASAAAGGGYEQTYLAYATGGARTPLRIWAAGADGAPAELLGPGLQPLLAPDGKLVAATLEKVGSAPALAVYSVAGAPASEYARQANVTAVPLAWSPDSRYLAVSLQSDRVRDVGRDSSLAVIDVSTGAVRTIAHGIVAGASFAPGGSDMLAYALASSLRLGAPVNVHTSEPDGSDARTLTHDGRSLEPVWGAEGIAYDRERLRRLQAPQYEIWLMAGGGGDARQLTHIEAGPLVSGLVPLAFSASGTRLLAEFEGQDTSAAWTVEVPSGHARQLRAAGVESLIGAGISADGTAVLADADDLQSPPSAGHVVTVPFAGGPASVLVAHGGEASWSE
ncbi:MAG TPA: hypothetical protein VKV16_03265 [Solirubrobacteraceae bacterium]|nr:hypothetical protein [Solirubrobacteraceae bacterium]